MDTFYTAISILDRQPLVVSKMDEIRKSAGINLEMNPDEYLNYYMSQMSVDPTNPNIKYAYIGHTGQFIGTSDSTNNIVAHILLAYMYLLNYYVINDNTLNNPAMTLDDIGCIKIKPNHLLLYGNASVYKEKKFISEQQEKTLKSYIENNPIIAFKMGISDDYIFTSDISRMDRIMLYKRLSV